MNISADEYKSLNTNTENFRSFSRIASLKESYNPHYMRLIDKNNRTLWKLENLYMFNDLSDLVDNDGEIILEKNKEYDMLIMSCRD
ncbi:MAG TPA: hypothetical protein PKK33_04005 [Candidatus Cloacimonadota bacterium]|nr:hypothetical protein [Candidatus Cloacimonadota bacterium]